MPASNLLTTRTVGLGVIAGLAGLLGTALPAHSAYTATPSAPARATDASERAIQTAGDNDPSDVDLVFRQRAAGLNQPVLVTSARDGSRRMFVVERAGLIRIYRGGEMRKRPYLDIRGRVESGGGEQGLLGLAFHPRFNKRPAFWVAYTRANGDLRISRFRADDAGDRRIDPDTERKVLTVPHREERNHNAGQLLFGPKDDKLYIGTGDGGGRGDPFGRPQKKRSLSGKVLRIDPMRSCGGKRYCNPKGNPFAGGGRGQGEIWLLGLRNPYRFSADAKNGNLWVADVGESRYEEVTRIREGRGGRNLGWSCYEGRVKFKTARCRAGADYRMPTLVYSHDQGQSITGGYVYRGHKYAGLLSGLYVFADFISGAVWVYRGGERSRAGSLSTVTSFGEGDRRELWATTYGGDLYVVQAKRS